MLKKGYTNTSLLYGHLDLGLTKRVQLPGSSRRQVCHIRARIEGAINTKGARSQRFGTWVAKGGKSCGINLSLPDLSREKDLVTFVHEATPKMKRRTRVFCPF